MDDGDLTVTEAAALLGVSRSAVQQLIGKRFASRRLGPLHVLRREDVEAYRREASQRRRPGPPSRRPQTPAEGE